MCEAIIVCLILGVTIEPFLDLFEKIEQKGGFMKLFNAIQIVTLFGCFPFLLNWLWFVPFAYAGALFWVALVAYLVFFVWITSMIFLHFERQEKGKI